MKTQRRSFRKMIRRCAAFYRWFAYYRKRVRLIEAELGSQIEAC